MDSPGNDWTSVTGEVASGCNQVLFTTGRGSVFGFKPVPSIKIATNTSMYERMSEDMDFNAGRILNGCDELQGYYFARPLPADDLARFIAGRLATLP